MTMNTISLTRLLRQVQQVLELNFLQTIWVEGEIAGMSSSNGHIYLELVEKEENYGKIAAKARATIWKNIHYGWNGNPTFRLNEILQEGNNIRVKAKVNFHEIYGLSLNIQDIDPSFTLGDLALERIKTIEALRNENLLKTNKALPLPAAIQRIAIISSASAEGYQDFINHLSQNIFGYAFNTTLFASRVQGNYSITDMSQQLDEIARSSYKFDCVVIIRGGGSKLDLLAFDDLELARKVATCPLPVLSGIGHDSDVSAVDLVAHQHLKTPTAVADFILLQNQYFENSLDQAAKEIKNWTEKITAANNRHINMLYQNLRLSSQSILNNRQSRISKLAAKLQTATPYLLKAYQRNLEEANHQLQLLKPEAILQRGYSLTTLNGKALTKEALQQIGATLETYTTFGVIISTIVKGKEHE